MKTELSKKELKTLAKRLEELEYQLLCSYGLKNINGGFVKIEMFDYDDDVIDVEITVGSEDDTGSNVSSENDQLDRKTLEFIN